jgi:L-amino acid N-acyltransferase YncA/protein-tyrosine-phosphatase
MAEGFLRALGGDRFEAASAGTEATRVHPLAIRVMGEVGIDIGGHSSKTFEGFLARPWDSVITVCDNANERCPIFPARTARLHWSFEDPSAASGSEDERLRVFRRIRDEIRGRIEGFLATGQGASEAPSMPITTRRATRADAGAIARIYNDGIEDRIATFETQPRTAEDVARWFDGVHPVVVAEEDGGRIVGFASTSSYRPRECYARIAEFSVYVARDQRGRGVGRRALEALIEASAEAGLHKLVSRIFPENVASRAACRSVGFREVGIYKAHGQLEGVWKDCVIVERIVSG